MGVCPYCRLYTLASCIWQESRTRVVRDETGRVWLSTLLPRTVNPREARARWGRTDESKNKEIFIKFTVADVLANRLKFFFQNFCFFSTFWIFFSKFWWVFFRKLRPTFPNVFVAWWVCKWFWHAARGSSQARHETLWLVHHGPLKKRDPNEARNKCRGYTRGSKARRVFPSALSLSPCLGFPQWECTAGIKNWTVTDETERSGFVQSCLPPIHAFSWQLFFLSSSVSRPSGLKKKIKNTL